MNNQQPTKEEIDAFLVDYGALLKKHNIDFVHFPMFIPDGAVPPAVPGFKVIVQSQPIKVVEEPIKSPFIASPDA